MSGDHKFRVVFVLGPPGSGKGTQSVRISKQLNFEHLSAGDLLRAERDRKGSEYGQLIEGHMRGGTIVPVEITCALLENAMKESADRVTGFLIDGFPRNEDNLKGWQKQMGSKTDLLFVLFLDCPEEVCINRCLGRNQGRTDDNTESLKKRIINYHKETMPIIKYYEKDNLVKTIDATKSADEVFEDVRKAFQHHRI